MGCIQTGRRTIISVNPILGQLNKQENLTTMQSPTANKKRSTLKEITKLAFNSKDIKIKSCISLANSKPEDDYRIINKLGKGSFGSVYKVEHKITKEIRAMKIIKRNILSNNEKKINNKFVKEIQVLKELEHPKIILMEFVFSHNPNTVWLSKVKLPLSSIKRKKSRVYFASNNLRIKLSSFTWYSTS